MSAVSAANTVRKLEIVTEPKLPTGIRKRGESFMVDVSYRGTRRTGTFNTLEAAIEGQGSIKADLMREAKGVSVSDDGKVLAISWTLQQALAKTVEQYWTTEKAADAKKLTRNAEAAIEYFGADRRLDSITTEDVDDYIKTMEDKKLECGTVNRKLSALSRLFTVAAEYKMCSMRPIFHRQEEDEDARISYLNEAEEEAVLGILTQWSKDEHAEAVCVLVDTGMRESELWRLEAKDCHWNLGKQGRIIIWSTSKKRKAKKENGDSKTKNKKSRTIPMTTRVREILQRRAELHPTGPLFMVMDGNDPEVIRKADNAWLSHTWDEMRAQMGRIDDEDFSPYILRHTFASRLVQRGVRIEVVQKLLGHRNIRTTMRYAKFAPSNFDDAIDVLE